MWSSPGNLFRVDDRRASICWPWAPEVPWEVSLTPAICNKCTAFTFARRPRHSIVALAHPRMAHQGEVIPRKGSERGRKLNKWTAWTNKRIHRNLIFLPCSGIEPGTSGYSDIAMTTTPSAHDIVTALSLVVFSAWGGLRTGRNMPVLAAYFPVLA